MTTPIWSFPDPNCKFRHDDFRLTAMSFSLLFLLLPTYFSARDRTNVGTETYGDSKFEENVKCWVYYSLFRARWFLLVCIKWFRIFFIFISYRVLVKGGKEGSGEGMLEISQRSFPLLSLAKRACYWNSSAVNWTFLYLCVSRMQYRNRSHQKFFSHLISSAFLC